MKTKCRLFGHHWIFPDENLQIPSKHKIGDVPLINVEVIKKPKCKRCGTEDAVLCFIGEKNDVLMYYK